MSKFLMLLMVQVAFIAGLCAQTLPEQILSAKWQVKPGAKIENNVFSCTMEKGIGYVYGANLALPKAEYAGKKVKVTYEAKGTDLKMTDGKAWGNAKILFSYKSAPKGKVTYIGSDVSRGTTDWKTYTKIINVPADIISLNCSMGLQFATGTVEIRNLKFTVVK